MILYSILPHLTITCLILIIVYVDDMEAKQQINIETMTLNDFMEVHPLGQPPSDMAGVVTFFDLDEDIKNMAEVLNTFKDSYIFKVCWEKQAKDLATSERDDEDPDESGVVDIMASPEIIHNDIFQPCYADYTEIYSCLKNGSIRLGEVDRLFKAYKGKYQELTQDLEIMCRVDHSKENWIPMRVQQIEQYHELHLAVAAAQIIMMVKRILCPQGDFRVLQTLLAAVSGDVLNYITLHH